MVFLLSDILDVIFKVRRHNMAEETQLVVFKLKRVR